MRRPRLTYANVMSTIAVFIALGGTSYAVARNSIGNAQLKRNAVTSVKVKNGSLRAGDLAPGTRLGQRGQRGPPGPGVPATPEPWKPLAFAPGWANYGGGFVAGSYRKDQLGRVQLRGLVTHVPGSAARSPIAVLPPGYRPPGGMLFTVGGGEPQATARVDVATDGTVIWFTGPAWQPGNYTSLDQVAYWPE